jgi:hypothetical protein
MANPDKNLEAATETPATEDAATKASEAYEPPILRELGSLLDLTQSGRGAALERFLGSH